MPTLLGSAPRPSKPIPQLVDHDTAVRALPRRPLGWPLPALVLLALGSIAAGVSVLSHRTDLVTWSIVVTVILVTSVVVFGVRTHARGRSIDKMIEAANPILQGKSIALPTRDLIRASRWQQGWVGLPGQMKMRYAADVVDENPAFAKELTTQVTNRFGQPYKVKKNDSRRCIITLVIDEDPDATAIDEDKRNLESVLASAIPGVSIDEVSRTDEDGLQTATFTWPASATSRVMKRMWQRQAIESVQAAFDNSALTISFDLAARIGSVAPITPLPDVIPHPPRNPETPMKVEFGRFRDGTPCIWDLDDPLPHVLIVGGTGGGKTILLLSLLTALHTSTSRASGFGNVIEATGDMGAEVWPIDPKRLGLFNLDLIPGAQRAATREAAMVDYLLSVKKQMDDRYEYLEQNGPQLRAKLHPIVLVVDEGEEMADMLNEWWQSGAGKADWCNRMGLEKAPSGSKHPVMTHFGSILRLGREARVHVILASQQAASTWLTTSSRSQFAVRIALRNLEQSTSLMTFGSLAATSGLENKPGRAWVSVGMGVAPEHAQIYWTPKLAPGLNDADREILHGLGITLPDDPDFDGPTPVAVAPDPITESIPVFGESDDEPSSTRPRFVAEPEQNESPDDDDPRIVEVAVGDLESGMRILVDVDGKSVEATVDAVDEDLHDPDYLVVTYVTADGEDGAVSVSDSELVSVRIPED